MYSPRLTLPPVSPRVSLRSGACRVCGCTEYSACETGLGPCWWVDDEETLCSNCAGEEA